MFTEGCTMRRKSTRTRPKVYRCDREIDSKASQVKKRPITNFQLKCINVQCSSAIFFWPLSKQSLVNCTQSSSNQMSIQLNAHMTDQMSIQHNLHPNIHMPILPYIPLTQCPSIPKSIQLKCPSNPVSVWPNVHLTQCPSDPMSIQPSVCLTDWLTDW